MSTIKEYGKIGITFEGEYDPSRSYERLCIVEYSGLNFMSKVDGTTSIPTKNKDEWIQLSVPGLPGEKGEQGDKGDKGDKGDIGPRGINLKLVICYKSSETQPSPPTGGQYDFVGNTIIYPEGWGESDNIPSPIWKSEKVFYEDPALEGEWSNPMCISGKDGKPGEDGKSLEFIYYVTKKPSIKPDISNLPSENVDDYVPTLFGWTDRPQGVDPANRVEWICTRKKINGVWGDWEGPTIWSAYGEKGQDGDGVEYIFYLDSSGQPPMNPTPEDWQYNTDYQNTDVEYVPKDLGWTDVATGISVEYPYEWQCVRKFKNGFWQPFEGPYVWSRLGEKGNTGDRIIEKFAITESSSIVPTFVKDDINPGSNWTMVSPIRTKDEQAIWKIQTYVNYKNEFVEWTDEEDNVHSGWTEPILITGVNGVDAIPVNYWVYIYKRQDEGSPEIPTFTDPTQFEQAGWSDIPYVDTNNDGVVDIKGIWWECAGLVNGVDETVEWKTLRQINSSTTKTLFAVNNSSTIAPGVNTNVRNPEGWSETYNKPNIYEFVWQITAEINAQDQLIGEWQGPVCISREHIEINDEGNINIGGEDTGVNVLNLHLELDNDSETIPTNSEGNVIGTISVITTAQLYNGSKLITERVTYSAVATKCTLKETENTTGIFEVVALDSGTDVIGYYVEITATYKNIGITKKFNISKSLGNTIYKIIPNITIINDDLPSQELIIKIKGTDNIEEYINKLPDNYKIILKTIDNHNYYEERDRTSSFNDYGELIHRFGKGFQKITFELYNDNILIDIEDIGIIKNGENGTSIKIKGSLTSVNQLPAVPTDASDCYVIGLDIYCWDGQKWFNAGQFKGVDGNPPIISEDGYWMFWNGTDYEKTQYYAIGDGHLPHIGKNGNWYEWDEVTKSYKDTRFAAKVDNGTSYYMHTAYSNNSDGTDFDYGDNIVTDYEYIGIYTGTEADQSALVKTDYKWTKYRGAEGKQGIDGIHGVSIYIRYQIGNDIKPKVSVLPSEVTGVSNYWTETIPNVTEDYPYIWCTQGKKVYTSQKKYYYSWSEPFRLSGTNGLDGIGDKGDPGKIIYPAGIYANNVTYQATDKKAPYVWDPDYGAYYVYLATTPWKGTNQNNMTPGQEYAANKNSNTNKWELFEQFEAIYAKIGIIGNGLIGSAVFNGDYMFSQQGYTTLDGSTKTTDYEKFNPDNPFGPGNEFYPNFCINFDTGDFWLQRTCFKVENGILTLAGFEVGPYGLSKLFDNGNQLIIDNLGIMLGTPTNKIKHFGLFKDGTVCFYDSKCFFNSDGSGYLGGNEEDAIISWSDDTVRIGKGDNALVYTIKDGVIKNQLNNYNVRHYVIMSSTLNITNLTGFEHDILFRYSEYNNISLYYNETVASEKQLINGYCGTFTFTNVLSSAITVKFYCRINGGAASNISSINIPANSCNIYKLYLYGYSKWYLVKVS